MDKVSKIFPIVAFCSYFVKLLVLGASWADAPVLAIAAGLLLALEFKTKDKKIEGLQEEITILRTLLDSQTKELEIIKSSLSRLNVAQIKNTFSSR